MMYPHHCIQQGNWGHLHSSSVDLQLSHVETISLERQRTIGFPIFPSFPKPKLNATGLDVDRLYLLTEVGSPPQFVHTSQTPLHRMLQPKKWKLYGYRLLIPNHFHTKHYFGKIYHRFRNWVSYFCSVSPFSVNKVKQCASAVCSDVESPDSSWEVRQKSWKALISTEWVIPDHPDLVDCAFSILHLLVHFWKWEKKIYFTSIGHLRMLNVLRK